MVVVVVVEGFFLVFYTRPSGVEGGPHDSKKFTESDFKNHMIIIDKTYKGMIEIAMTRRTRLCNWFLIWT